MTQIKDIKEHLKDKNAPFGVDLLLPQVGGNARKTNYDYTKGKSTYHTFMDEYILRLDPVSSQAS
jgi:hypothetical protein